MDYHPRVVAFAGKVVLACGHQVHDATTNAAGGSSTPADDGKPSTATTTK